MSHEERKERLDSLSKEFIRLLDFHEKSCRDIETKARHWLTLSMPTTVTLFGILLQKSSGLKPLSLAAASSCTLCLTFTTLYLLYVNYTSTIESGVLVPPNRDSLLVKEVIQSKAEWRSHEFRQIEHLLEAIKNNEQVNSTKSERLGIAQTLLFVVTPLSILISTGIAFCYAAPFPWLSAAVGWTSDLTRPTSVWIAIGLLSGISVTTITFLFRHHRLTILKYGKL